MKLLQWSTIDLQNGLGGVEVQARSIARELPGLGVECSFSMNARDLDPEKLCASSVRAVLYHGSAIPRWEFLRQRGSPQKTGRPYRFHMLHGSTLERMIACEEWLYLGGYLAFLRELVGVFFADHVFSVNSTNYAYRFARLLGKKTTVCANGWDSGAVQEALPQDVEQKLAPLSGFWLFIGRGSDPVKGADRLHEVILAGSRQKWVVVPGEGFEATPGVISTGRLSNTQVSRLLTLARGLLVPSRYEGHPLVISEALALGTPVVASDVGGIRKFDSSLEGLVKVENLTPQCLIPVIVDVEERFPESGRQERALKNRQKLRTWRQVAATIAEALR